MAACIDATLRCPRVLARRWRARRVRRWESVPCLMLRPIGREIFVCDSCGFSNIYGNLCPWCCGPCPEDAQSRKQHSLRRRVTSPSLLSDTQKAQLDNLDRPAILKKQHCNEVLPHDEVVVRYRAQEAQTIADSSEYTISPAAQQREDDIRKKHRVAVCYSATDIVATATKDVDMQSFIEQLLIGHDDRTPKSSSSCFSGCGSSSSTNLESEPNRMLSPNVVTIDSPASVCASSRPSLRRKRRMHVLRQRSSCSLRKSVITSASILSTHRLQSDVSFDYARSYTSKSRPDSPLSDLTDDYIPLGDLKRPLYTAIRKNMTPPSTAEHALPIIDSSAFQAAVFDHISRTLDIPCPTVGRRSPTPMPPYIAPRRTVGFSISGTTELRMDLDRVRSTEGAESAYKFTHTKRIRTVRGKVKSFGRGIKELFFGRTP